MEGSIPNKKQLLGQQVNYSALEGIWDMSLKRLRFVFVNLFLVCALVISLQGVAQTSAMLETSTCKAMLPKCFPIGSPKWKELTGFEKAMPKPAKVFSTGKEIDSNAKKPICVGSGCPSSDVKEDSIKL